MTFTLRFDVSFPLATWASISSIDTIHRLASLPIVRFFKLVPSNGPGAKVTRHSFLVSFDLLDDDDDV